MFVYADFSSDQQQSCGEARKLVKFVQPQHQMCPKCGAGLEIRNGERILLKGYSPFTADKYALNLPENIAHLIDEERNKYVEDG